MHGYGQFGAAGALRGGYKQNRRNDANPELTEGGYLFRLEPRSLADIRALGANSPKDDMRFAAVSRVSEINLALYEEYLQPTIRAAANESLASVQRFLHPNRLRFAIFSDKNPWMASLAVASKSVRNDRRPAAPDNPMLAVQGLCASTTAACLEAFGNVRDAITEAVFLGIYGSSALQALVGLGRDTAASDFRIERDLVREADEAHALSELERRFEAGGPLEAAVRAAMYVNSPERSVDERGFNLLKQFRASRPAKERQSLAEIKELVKEQSLLIRLDEERAVRAIPKLLPEDEEKRRSTLELVRQVVEARGAPKAEQKTRLHRIESLFDGSEQLRTGAAHA